ncbi:MAG: hypothetical protein ABSG80_06060 [Verrucomicrobiota bacterium]
MNFFFQRLFAAGPGGCSGGTGDGPWRAKTVLAAAAVALMGLGLWFSDAVKGRPAAGPGITAADTGSPGASGALSNWSKPVPGYVRICVSYVGGFFIGWAFRRFLKVAAAGTILIIALLALGRYVGCDTTRTQEEAKRSSAWVQREATETRDHLKGLLPSATTGGAGMFFGFRRKRKTTAAEPPKPPVDKPTPVQ